MKKRVITGLILMLSIGTFSGCGKEEPEIPTTKEVISVSINTSVKAPNAMTKDELLALSPGAIKEMVETYLPNYRAIYEIPDDMEMTDDDYLTLRDLICEQLYGVQSTETESAGAGKDSSNIDFQNYDHILGADGSYLDPDWIYYAPCDEFIEGLTDDRFREYIVDLMAYWNKSNITKEDVDNLDEDGLDELRKMVYDEFCVEWGTVSIPTVDELAESEAASIINTNIEDGLKASFERYKETVNEGVILGEGEHTEEEINAAKDFIASIKNESMTDEDARKIYEGFDITEETTYDEFIEIYKNTLLSENFTIKDENGNDKEIEKADVENYFFAEYVVSKYLDSKNSVSADNAGE